MMALPSNLSIVAKASRPKIDDTLLNRDISDIFVEKDCIFS